ncbi:glycosyltransferase family 4 protein [Rhizobium rosettiformans]|uniref:glycosyltransferase family 4 protein n=1 Tax=Rhizobium rosettiformans TaxID=1368430 RepID=UPI002862224F|nr:glycosyltransferase family 4 protein [Rhizobium rosettiformans]MDR7027110.1 glycosyltransferase involved in cell wall biosynthesis [Rhizobium rosettiformans]MDR7065231.1 glycosyltransferase involved in cell wall biosynthesis [Rhizobium rosettiformans]
MADAQTLRIVHCFRSPIGGIFRHVRDLAELHSAAGHEVGILCDSSTGGAHEDRLFDQIMPFLKLGVTRFPIGRSVGLKDMAALAESYKLIKELQPDILHGHGAKGGVIARLIGSLLRVRRYRVARLYSPHGGSLHFSRRSLSGQGVFMAERILERMTESISFVCDYERTTYETKIGKPHCAATRIYNGISERDFGRIPVTEDGVDFAYIGMLRDLKGPDVFINAFAEAERLVGRPLSGLIIGDGPDLERYQRMVEQKGLGRRIGFRPAMPIGQAFALSDIVVVPSRAEAMPYIVLEALAAEKTVIASRVGGIPEILGSDSEALVEAGRADLFGAVMAKALTDPSWSKRTMPTADAFRSRFSAVVMAREAEALYRAQLARI